MIQILQKTKIILITITTITHLLEQLKQALGVLLKWALSVVRVLITEPRNGIVDRDLDQDEERIT